MLGINHCFVKRGIKPSNVHLVDMNGSGGTLLGPNVFLGSYGSRERSVVTIGGTRVEVVERRCHPSYTFALDFCLYRLSTPVTTSGAIVTLTVNTDGSRPTYGQNLTVLGRGLTSPLGSPWIVIRDRVVVQALPTASSDSIFCLSMDNATHMRCAGPRRSENACQGSHGDPLVIRNGNEHVLVAAVSYGVACANAYPLYYARVSPVVDWIRSVACNEWGSSVNGLCGEG
jgi:Trypsin